MQQESDSQAAFVRTAGVLGLVVAVTGILINLVSESAGPAPNAPIEEVVAFIGEQTLSLQIGNGLRMAVAGFLPVFAVGVYIWLGPLGGGWRMVGMLGLAMVPIAGIIANCRRLDCGMKMTLVRVESFTISLDGYGAGPNQDVSNPLGIET